MAFEGICLYLGRIEWGFLFEKEVLSLRGLTGFGNSLEFAADGSTPTRAVCIIKDRGKVVGAAGAAASSVEGMWEVGVDVLEGYRNARLGTWLVRRLTKELTDRNILPFYSASVTNIGSQMVASRCGYIPAWVDTFGTTLDGSSVYQEIVSRMT
ncbi:GNAT family N-acetyltransferase [Schaedlerella arabinosiphila]|uniref:GNAT family N-acetyltransferase n=1 Tax=Schaedlerella arabinosiphila TaxID=2044587 RepID=A0A9X5H7Y8_9FIRM|nr:GNAT family N-acetyltransferase [Schaedlerella arabinosiphila]